MSGCDSVLPALTTLPLLPLALLLLAVDGSGGSTLTPPTRLVGEMLDTDPLPPVDEECVLVMSASGWSNGRCCCLDCISPPLDT